MAVEIPSLRRRPVCSSPACRACQSSCPKLLPSPFTVCGPRTSLGSSHFLVLDGAALASRTRVSMPQLLRFELQMSLLIYGRHSRDANLNGRDKKLLQATARQQTELEHRLGICSSLGQFEADSGRNRKGSDLRTNRKSHPPPAGIANCQID